MLVKDSGGVGSFSKGGERFWVCIWKDTFLGFRLVSTEKEPFDGQCCGCGNGLGLRGLNVLFDMAGFGGERVACFILLKAEFENDSIRFPGAILFTGPVLAIGRLNVLVELKSSY